jgi:hypothetical protein
MQSRLGAALVAEAVGTFLFFFVGAGGGGGAPPHAAAGEAGGPGCGQHGERDDRGRLVQSSE